MSPWSPDAWTCPRCNSDRWVAASLNQGRTIVRQCVPCGHYSADPVGPTVGTEAPR